jgi:hypothetical protein
MLNLPGYGIYWNERLLTCVCIPGSIIFLIFMLILFPRWTYRSIDIFALRIKYLTIIVIQGYKILYAKMFGYEIEMR